MEESLLVEEEKQEPKGFIYTITNTLNGKQYVGQTNNPKRRWAEHRATGNTGHFSGKSHLYYAMQKYGINVFQFEVIEETSLDLIHEREIYWIDKLNTLVPNGYNMTPGGEALYGENNPFYGRTHSEKTKQLISEKNKGRKLNEEQLTRKREKAKEVGLRMRGKIHLSDEAKEKISQKNRENGCYERHSNRMKGNKLYLLHHYKKVEMIDKETLEVLRVFNNAIEAGAYIKDLGRTKAKHPSSIITNVCNGHDKTGAGYIWRYVEEHTVEEDVSTKETSL